MPAEICGERQETSLNSWIAQRYYAFIISILLFKIIGINMIASAGESQMSLPLRADHTGQVSGVDSPQKEHYSSLLSKICSDPLQIQAAFGVFSPPLKSKTDLFLHVRMKLRSHLLKDSRLLGILMYLISFGPVMKAHHKILILKV